jgi:aldehyde dehydrogenase (NAD+)
MKVAKIPFTGSTATGLRIQEAAKKSNLKRVTLELGGKSLAIVFDDADIPTAIFWSIVGITSNTGQVCAASSRLYVQDTIMDSFMSQLKAAFEGIASTFGADPQAPTTQSGPVIDRVQFDKVMAFIEAGKDTEVLVGGVEHKKQGHYIAPTIFIDPDEDSSILQEEIFGPVLCAKSFKTEEEALKMANNT